MGKTSFKALHVIAAGGLFLFCSPLAGALTGRENVQAVQAKMDRYLSLAGDESKGPLSPRNMKEALSILDGYERLMRIPSYMVEPHFNHDPANGDQTVLRDQVNFVKILAKDMIETQREALSFHSPYSAVQKEGIKAGYVGDRTTMLKLLVSMRRALKLRGEASAAQAGPAKGEAAPSMPAAPASAAKDDGENKGQVPHMLR